MEKAKLYFRDEDSTSCYTLEGHLLEAKEEGLKEITLLEAIPDNDNPEFVWCSYHGEVTERSECKKSECSYYESNSGRGVCKYRGRLFEHGNEVTFQVN